MSLWRLVYYSAIISGWAAFFGWLLAEITVMPERGKFGPNLLDFVLLAVVGAMVGAAIGAGLNIVAGMSNMRLKNLVMRIPTGLIGGGVGGAVGIVLGNLIYPIVVQILGGSRFGQIIVTIGLPRALGFMVLGIGVGIVEGIYERSPQKIRNGLIGGLVGGLVGGLLFNPINSLLHSSEGIASRATTFVILGICIGAMVGFVQVILKNASLRVMDGYGVGREIILGDAVTFLGRGDHLRLPFLGTSNADLEAEHVKIVRRPDGSFTAEDNQTKLGTSVRGAGAASYDSVQQPRKLNDGDVIRFGPNLVRFSQRKRRPDDDEESSASRPPAATVSSQQAPPPPPPPSKRKDSTSPVSPKPQQPVSATPPAQSASATSTPSKSSGSAKPQTNKPSSTGLPPPPPPPPRKK